MTFPASAWATGDLVSGSQLNGLPVRIADTTLTAVASSIIFGAIPDHYAHLLIVAYLRGTVALASTGVNLRINSDAGANYDRQYLYGSAAGVVVAENFGAAAVQVGNISGSSAPAGIFSALRVLIPHYAGTANNKSALSRWTLKQGVGSGGLFAGTNAAFWRSDAAITVLTLLAVVGDFAVGSRATLYGLP